MLWSSYLEIQLFQLFFLPMKTFLWLGSKLIRGDMLLIYIMTINFNNISERKIVFDRIINFLIFGFLQGRFTVTQLLSTFNDLEKSQNLSIATDVIFLDLAKIFDSVPHERLLLKLKGNGINGSLLNRPRHFRTCRNQRAVVRGTCSD